MSFLFIIRGNYNKSYNQKMASTPNRNYYYYKAIMKGQYTIPMKEKPEEK